MNSTNRGANRLLIFVCGLLLLVVGAAGAAALLVPAVRVGWKDSSEQISNQVQTWFENTQIGGINNSWIMPAILVLLVIAVIILISFIVKQGRGHTGTAFDESTSENGRTVIESSVAEHAIQDALKDRSEFVASSVSTYSVKRTPVLKVSVTCRRGVSPRDAADIVEQKLRALDVLLGRELPALIQISGGFRSRVTKTTRLQ
ncbi:hypothetical protein [Agreia sp. COWG]|uniref:hypothetical protein n=1 Tax=Agreia sp. COWG TaxID=2773266 RepID=UPI001926D7EA|nr:hypothetical protein [Agreia sp. COWG]CAD6008904.1 conserved exported protein of unknown function [Agreia sp. COWG]